MPLIARVGVILLGVIALSVGFHLHRHPTSQQNGRTKTVALQNGRDGSNRDINRDIYSNSRSSIRRLLRLQQSGGSSEVDAAQTTTEGTEVGGVDRKELWKKVSKLERRAVELLAEGSDASVEEAVKLLAESVTLKRQDPFIALAESYGAALDGKESGKLLADEAAQRILEEMKQVNVPPHLAALSKKGLGVGANGAVGAAADGFGADADLVPEDVDPGSTFSDTVTEKIRVKVNSFYDADKSDPANGKVRVWIASSGVPLLSSLTLLLPYALFRPSSSCSGTRWGFTTKAASRCRWWRACGRLKSAAGRRRRCAAPASCPRSLSSPRATSSRTKACVR